MRWLGVKSSVIPTTRELLRLVYVGRMCLAIAIYVTTALKVRVAAPLDILGEPAPAESAPDPAIAAPAWLVDPDGVRLPAGQPPAPAPTLMPVTVPAPVPAPVAAGLADRATPIWAGPTPVPVGPAGTYRSYSAPPTITPSFTWPPTR